MNFVPCDAKGFGEPMRHSKVVDDDCSGSKGQPPHQRLQIWLMPVMGTGVVKRRDYRHVCPTRDVVLGNQVQLGICLDVKKFAIRGQACGALPSDRGRESQRGMEPNVGLTVGRTIAKGCGPAIESAGKRRRPGKVLDAFDLRLQGNVPYEILGVPRHATRKGVRKALHRDSPTFRQAAQDGPPVHLTVPTQPPRSAAGPFQMILDLQRPRDAVHALAIIPAFNEEASIADVVTRVRKQGLEVLVLDDGSHDETAARARAAGAEVVSNRHNRGLGRTIRRGLEEALKRGADVIVQLDADGQHDPDEIPSLLGPIEANEADFVLGARQYPPDFHPSWIKRSGNRAFSWVLRKLTGAEVQDGQTGFRAMRREVVKDCLPINEFSYTQEMIIRAAKEGYIIRSVPVKVHPRQHGTSRLFRNPITFARQGWWIIIRTWRDYHPLRFFVLPGLFFLLLSLVAAGFVAWHIHETGGLAGRVGTLVVSGVLFLFAMQLVFLGLLADMIRTHTKY